ncbi:MAG: c-type cytochrome [Desulfuromonadales bacterium]
MDRQEDRSANRNAEPPPWINPALAFAALLALAAVLAALWSGWHRGPHHHGLVADITVNLSGHPIREHCTTCHTEGGQPRQSEDGWSSAPHPDIAPHLPERLGCTGCHLGEGMALDRTISHGLPGLGARKVLSGPEVQGRCYACHEVEPLEGAEASWAGYELYIRNACNLCHHIRGLSGGFGYGPELSDIGSQLGLEHLMEAVRDPAKEPPNSIMPRFPLSHNQVRNLAFFLKSRVSKPLSTSPLWAAAGKPALPAVNMVPEGEKLKTGDKLLWQGGCLACHRFGSEDGRIAPDLSEIGAMRSRDYISTFLIHPSRLIPGAIMPSSTLDEAERIDLATYLANTGGKPPDPLQPRQTYMRFCQRCHAANGDGRGLIQPNLARFPRPFADNAGFFRRIGDERLKKSIAEGIPGTSMPPYKKILTDPGRDDLIDLVFQAFIGTDRHDKTSPPPLPQKPRELPLGQGDALFDELCTRCHGRTGTGTGPEAPDHLPQPRNLTNTPYFATVEDERILQSILDGVPGTAMPAWRTKIRTVDAWALVEKVRQLSGTLR